MDSYETLTGFDGCPRSTAVPVAAVPSMEPGQPGSAEAAQPGGPAAGGARAQGHGEHASVVIARPNECLLLDWPTLQRAAKEKHDKLKFPGEARSQQLTRRSYSFEEREPRSLIATSSITH
jgi:hypothetical protein